MHKYHFCLCHHHSSDPPPEAACLNLTNNSVADLRGKVGGEKEERDGRKDELKEIAGRGYHGKSWGLSQQFMIKHYTESFLFGGKLVFILLWLYFICVFGTIFNNVVVYTVCSNSFQM